MGCIGKAMENELLDIELKQKDILLEYTLEMMGYKKVRIYNEKIGQTNLYVRDIDDILLTIKRDNYHHILLTAPEFRTQEKPRYVSGIWG